MFASYTRTRHLQPLRVLSGACVVALTLGGCGQRSALYLPDRNARVVTHPAAGSAPADSSAPASSPNAGSAATPR